MNTATDSLETNTPKTGGGFVVGQSATDLVGFYGTTPVAQPSSASQAAVTITAVTAIATTVFSTAASGVYGFQSSTAATALVTRARQMQVDVEAIGVLLNQLRSELVTLGVIAGS